MYHPVFLMTFFHMQFASLLSSTHAHKHETCLGNGRMIILDDKHGNK